MSLAALWCIASLAWSIEPSLAARRLIAAGCAGLAALAAARLINPRELAIAALLCSVGYLALGVATEIALGTFQPWRADYRLAGTLHPNNQGLNCALLVMAATYLAQFSKKYTAIFWACAAAGLAALWMTHSRTPLAALVIAESLFWFTTTTSRNRIVAGIGAVCLACVALFFAGGEFAERAANAVSMGRGDENELGELTGRVPLWEELSESIARRPIEGYGFSSFWTPRNIEDISESQYWAISVGHSAYIDLALGIGLVGVLLYGSIALWGMAIAVYRHIKLPAAGYGFIGVLLLFALLHGLLESAFANPGFVPLIAMSGLAMLAFVDPRQYVGAARHDAKPAEMTSIHVLSWRIKSP